MLSFIIRTSIILLNNVKHKLTKFKGFPSPIRWEIDPPVAFIIPGTDISVVENPIDFDAESDLIIKKIKMESSQKKKYAFEYRVGAGFEEVDADTQKWFKFY